MEIKVLPIFLLIFQEASIMYFVHSDCLPALDLSIQAKNECDRRLYAIATVESKEYCYAKKVWLMLGYYALVG